MGWHRGLSTTNRIRHSLVNPSQPLAQLRTLESVYRRSTERTSFTLIVPGIAGALALVLSIIGIYGVSAYAVGQRRRELAIRVALGAKSKHVSSIFLRRGMLMTGHPSDHRSGRGYDAIPLGFISSFPCESTRCSLIALTGGLAVSRTLIAPNTLLPNILY